MKDPFKNNVIIPDVIYHEIDKAIEAEINEPIANIIEKPALMIQELKADKIHYLRRFAWETTVLIKTEKKGNDYIAYDYLINPDNDSMSQLITKAKILTPY